MSVSLIGRSGALAFIKAKRLRIPLFMERVSAGFPSPAQDYVEQMLDLNELCIKRPAATFFVRVEGDSMINEGIFSGDTVLIKKTNYADSGDIIVALVDDSEATLKRLRKKGQSIALESANPAYETRILAPHRVKVQGKLIGLLRKY